MNTFAKLITYCIYPFVLLYMKFFGDKNNSQKILEKEKELDRKLGYLGNGDKNDRF